MTGLLPAISGGLVRALMAFASGYGVELGNDTAEAIVQGLLAGGSVGWTILDKFRRDRAVKRAAATGIVS